MANVTPLATEDSVKYAGVQNVIFYAPVKISAKPVHEVTKVYEVMTLGIDKHKGIIYTRNLVCQCPICRLDPSALAPFAVRDQCHSFRAGLHMGWRRHYPHKFSLGTKTFCSFLEAGGGLNQTKPQ